MKNSGEIQNWSFANRCKAAWCERFSFLESIPFPKCSRSQGSVNSAAGTLQGHSCHSEAARAGPQLSPMPQLMALPSSKAPPAAPSLFAAPLSSSSAHRNPSSDGARPGQVPSCQPQIPWQAGRKKDEPTRVSVPGHCRVNSLPCSEAAWHQAYLSRRNYVLSSSILRAAKPEKKK